MELIVFKREPSILEKTIESTIDVFVVGFKATLYLIIQMLRE